MAALACGAAIGGVLAARVADLAAGVADAEQAFLAIDQVLAGLALAGRPGTYAHEIALAVGKALFIGFAARRSERVARYGAARAAITGTAIAVLAGPTAAIATTPRTRTAVAFAALAALLGFALAVAADERTLATIRRAAGA